MEENRNLQQQLIINGGDDGMYEDKGNFNVDAYINSFPPGFRFCPWDEELIIYYLKNKLTNQSLPINRIHEVDLYQFHPQQLSEKYKIPGEKYMYFFTPRNRKYPNGSRPDRSASNGYWKATAADVAIRSKGHIVGYKTALVYFEGKPKQSTKTNWIMYEYKINKKSARKATGDIKLDDWVLCKVYKKIHKQQKANEVKPEFEQEMLTSSFPKEQQQEQDQHALLLHNSPYPLSINNVNSSVVCDYNGRDSAYGFGVSVHNPVSLLGLAHSSTSNQCPSMPENQEMMLSMSAMEEVEELSVVDLMGDDFLYDNSASQDLKFALESPCSVLTDTPTIEKF